MNFPYLQTNNKEINTDYRLAIATLAANILPFQDGILTRPEPMSSPAWAIQRPGREMPRSTPGT